VLCKEGHSSPSIVHVVLVFNIINMNFMKKTTPKEEARKVKRELGREQRGMDRERGQLDREEKKIIADIRAAAKRGNQGETRILAKQLVQLRAGKERLLSTKAQLGAIKTKTTLMATTHTMYVYTHVYVMYGWIDVCRLTCTVRM
jgi:hypothetical protein